MSDSADRLFITSHCPHCAKRVTQQVTRAEARQLLEHDALRFSCLRCAQQWQPDAQEKVELAHILATEDNLPLSHS